jgi:hypothetical protein
MAADFTPSQAGGAGAGTLNTELVAAWRDLAVQVVAEAAGSYAWTFADRPAGSAATFAAPSSGSTTFTPDVAGRYRVRLTTDTGVKTLIVGVTKNSSGVVLDDGIFMPAFGERASESSSGRGVAAVLDAVKTTVRAAIASAGVTLTGPQFAARVSGSGSAQAVSPADAAAMLDDQFTGLFVNTGALKTIDIWNDGDEGLLTFGPDFVGVSMQQTAKTGDAATVNMGFYPQGAFATATGANRKPGDFVVNHTAPTNGGTTRGQFIVQDVGDVVLRAYRGTASTDGVLEFGTNGFIEANDLTVNVNAALVTNADSVRFVATGGGGFAIWSDADMVQVGNVGGTVLADYSTTGIFYRAAALIALDTTSGGDVPPWTLDLRGSKASTTSTGATNTRGGATRIRGGEGKVAGTDKAGNVQVSLGQHVVDNSTAEFQVTFADATADPYENRLFAIWRNTAGRCRIESLGDAQWGPVGFLNINAGGLLSFEAGNAAWGSFLMQNGAATMFSSGYFIATISSYFTIRSASRLFTLDSEAGEQRVAEHFPARTTTTDATVTTIASWASSAITTPGTLRVFEGWVMVMHTAPDTFKQAFYVKFIVYDIGGVQTVGALTVTADTTFDDLVGETVVAATPLTVDVSANVVRLRATGVAACTNRWSPTVREVR